ncbi:cubilin-like, partial [Limulus polyphemus]|uniref:Cubilin-like n=1 Tax=Limulus polyphemus TaxID=6850 RepID=A0ABM1T7L3_LIMPO
TAVGVSNGVCDFCLYEGEGNFSSYGYPAPYRSNLECTYRIKRVDDSCELEVIFHDFDLTSYDTGTCTEDYLLVDDRRFCGNSWRGKSTTINFPRQLKELTFYFHSNNVISGGGFWIEVKRKPGTCTGVSARLLSSCDLTFFEENFFLRSPNYPDNYPTFTVCHYEVRRVDNDICGLEMKFLKFDIEPSDSCVYDYLKVDEKKLCGVITSEAVMLPPPPSCNICTESHKGEIHSYGYPNEYRNNLVCKYSIEEHNESYCSVTFNVVDFDVDYTPGCIGDYLELEDQRFCGNELQGHSRTVSFRGRQSITLVFQTDSVSVKRGFKINFQQHRCSGIRAPSVTGSNIQNHKDPSTVLDSSNAFERLNADPDREFEVFGSAPPPIGPKPTSLRETAESLSESNFDFETEEKILHFHSDGANPRPGFFIQVHQKECDSRTGRPILPTRRSCDRDFSARVFELTSVNYPEDYENLLNCHYSVKKYSNDVCSLELMFLDFSLQDGPNCLHDSLQINNELICGDISRGTVRSFEFRGQRTIIHFYSDAFVTNRGFRIRVTQKECIPSVTSPPFVSPTYCNKKFTAQEFEITSVNYPNNYNDNLNCRYTIVQHSDLICRLELTFEDFNIQESPGCSDDYLEVDGDRLCGQLRANTRQTIEFFEAAKVLSFHSDDHRNEKGYKIHVVQRECETFTTRTPFLPENGFCSDVYARKEFYLSSVNYPRNYDNNLDCSYVVRRHDNKVCSLRLQFLDFDVESSTDCEYDYLNVDGQKLCGTLPAGTFRTYDFQSFEKVIQFRTDSASSRPGFRIRVTQEECSGTSAPTLTTPLSKDCNRIFRELEFDIRSEEYPQEYPNNRDCQYTIYRQNNVCQLELTFISFDVEGNGDCRYDYLHVDGETLCGVLPVGESRILDFETSKKVIEFHSDSATTRQGFHIRARQVPCSTDRFPPGNSGESCDKTYDALEGVVQSHGYPRNYPRNLVCTYYFRPRPGYCHVVLKFSDFQLQSSRGLCEEDYLEINEQRYCGRQLIGQTKTLKISGGRDQAIVRFFTDDKFEDRGFKATYRQVSCSGDRPFSPPPPPFIPSGVSCDRLYASVEFEIMSPNFPDNYRNNLDCRYTILRISNRICNLRMTFESFDVESANSCEYDYLEIDGQPVCGILPRSSVREYEFRNFEFIMRFHSDSAESRPGFKIHVQQTDCREHFPPPPPYPKLSGPDRPLPPRPPPPPPRRPPISPTNCDDIINRPVFELQSVNFPDPYSNNLNCRYTIKRFGESVCQLELELVRFDLEPSADCQFDYLAVGDERLCGSLPRNSIRTFDFPKFEKKIYFRSDERAPGRGFLIRGRQIDCPRMPPRPRPRPRPPVLPSDPRELCDDEFSSEKFVLRSPGYPQSYPNNINCHYLIRKNNPGVCALDLTVQSFHLEENQNCDYDYLDIKGHKFCGQVPSGSIRRIYFEGPDSLRIYFYSDKATNRPGFSIGVQQITHCLKTTYNIGTSITTTSTLRLLPATRKRTLHES